MTALQVSKKLNVKVYAIRYAAKKINPHCFLNGTLKQFSEREIKELEVYFASIVKPTGTKRAVLARKVGISINQAKGVSDKLGLKKNGGYVSDEHVDEWMEIAAALKKKGEGRRKTQSRYKISKYTGIEQEILKNGYITRSELVSRFDISLHAVLSGFDKLEIFLYSDTINEGKKEIPVYRLNRVIWDEWKQDAHYLPKNGCFMPVGLNS